MCLCACVCVCRVMQSPTLCCVLYCCVCCSPRHSFDAVGLVAAVPGSEVQSDTMSELLEREHAHYEGMYECAKLLLLCAYCSLLVYRRLCWRRSRVHTHFMAAHSKTMPRVSRQHALRKLVKICAQYRDTLKSASRISTSSLPDPCRVLLAIFLLSRPLSVSEMQLIA